MPFKKRFAAAKKPTITVQTKKMSEGECCMPKRHCCGKMFMLILLIVNVVLTGLILCQQRNIESMRVGGQGNYKMLQEVFKSEGFQVQQKQQILKAMEMYQVPGATATNTAELPIQ